MKYKAIGNVAAYNDEYLADLIGVLEGAGYVLASNPGFAFIIMKETSEEEE